MIETMDNRGKIETIEAKVAEVKKLLEDSAAPFDAACMLVRELQGELQGALDTLEEAKGSEPWPKVGDKYSYVDEDGSIAIGMNEYHAIDVFRIKTSNCHRTEEQAIRHKEYITSPRVRARELVEMCEGFDPCGKAYVSFVDGEVQIKGIVPAFDVAHGGLQFEIGRYASDAVLMLGEQLIKVALGVIVGEEAERIVREYVGRDE